MNSGASRRRPHARPGTGGRAAARSPRRAVSPADHRRRRCRDPRRTDQLRQQRRPWPMGSHGGLDAAVTDRAGARPAAQWPPRPALVTATFREPVTGVSGSTFALADTTTGAVGSGERHLRCSVPGRRRCVHLPRSRRGILPRAAHQAGASADLAGNAAGHDRRGPLPPPSGLTTYDPPRTLNFDAGTYTGYAFDASGKVTGSKTYTLSRASYRLDQPAEHGHSRPRRDLVLRHQRGLGRRLGPGQQPRLRHGAHADHHQPQRDQLQPRAVPGLRLGQPHRLPVRRLRGGNRHQDLHPVARLGRSHQPAQHRHPRLTPVPGSTWSTGSWAGYWLPESTRLYLRGISQRDRLRQPAHRLFAAGTYTGYRLLEPGA